MEPLVNIPPAFARQIEEQAANYTYPTANAVDDQTKQGLAVAGVVCFAALLLLWERTDSPAAHARRRK